MGRQDMKEMIVKIKTLLDTRPDEIPKDSQFLLKFVHGKLARSNIHDKTYWIVATEAVIIAGQRTSVTGTRRRRMYNKHRMHMTRRARLGLPEAEEIIRLDIFTYGSNNGEQPTGSFRREAVTKLLSGRQDSSSVSITANPRSSKWYKPED